MESWNDLRVDIRHVMRRCVGASSISVCKAGDYRGAQKCENFHAKAGEHGPQIGKNRSRKVCGWCIMWWASVGILEDGFGFLRSLCNMAVMEEQGQSNRPRVERSGSVSPATRHWKAIHYRDSLRGRIFPALTIEEINEDIKANPDSTLLKHRLAGWKRRGKIRQSDKHLIMTLE